MAAYYNEIEPFAAAWLRNLIAGGHIAPGDVDERSIKDVQPDDLRGYTQCHFFAGIGGWSCALRLAGWADDRSVWTGSCPCQPFSSAGKGGGFADSRHLWPTWFRLIRECGPAIVLGEQVASRDGIAWWDHVATDLEAANHAVGAVDLPVACLEDGWHIRQRLWWVAHAEHAERWSQRKPGDDGRHGPDAGRSEAHGESGARGEVRELALPSGERREGERLRLQSGGSRPAGAEAGRDGEAGDVGHAGSEGLQERGSDGRIQRQAVGPHERQAAQRRGDVEWIYCRDHKWRPVEPGAFPLAHALPLGLGRLSPAQRELATVAGLHQQSLKDARRNRVGRLRGYGNAIVPDVAAEFIRAVML